jgi:hypothetical protein
MQSVPITTIVQSSNLAHGKVYSIQHYGINFVRDLRQVGGFLRVLSMFMSSIKFVIVCGLFEWKQICAGFFLSFVYVLLLEIKLSSVGIPLTSLTLPHFCSCPKPGPGFPTSCCGVFCFQLRWKVIGHFVEIGGIDDHHCLNFLFINS